MGEHTLIGNRVRPSDALREPKFLRIEGCHMEGAPPGSACACPGVCMSVYEITGDRLDYERRVAGEKAKRELLAEFQLADLSHPALIRRWIRDQLASSPAGGADNERDE